MKLELTQTSEFLRSSHIKRWGIVQTAVPQSIAEHSYRVWILVRRWGADIKMSREQQAMAQELALLHDLPEIRTGDAPTPHKSPEVKAMLAEIEEEILPELAELESKCTSKVKDLVKFCDTAESVLFLAVNGLGKHAADVSKLLEHQMIERLEKSSFNAKERETLMGAYRRTKAHT